MQVHGSDQGMLEGLRYLNVLRHERSTRQLQHSMQPAAHNSCHHSA